MGNSESFHILSDGKRLMSDNQPPATAGGTDLGWLDYPHQIGPVFQIINEILVVEHFTIFGAEYTSIRFPWMPISVDEWNRILSCFSEDLDVKTFLIRRQQWIYAKTKRGQ